MFLVSNWLFSIPCLETMRFHCFKYVILKKQNLKSEFLTTFAEIFSQLSILRLMIIIFQWHSGRKEKRKENDFYFGLITTLLN